MPFIDEEERKTILHRFKIILALLLSAVLVVSTCACAAFAASKPKKEDKQKLKLMHLADGHVLAQSLQDDNKGYHHMRDKEPKLLSESQAIFDKQLEKVREEKPDILVMTGDLTKDGEGESHEVIAAELEELKKEMPKMHIYMINGNHDINNKDGENYAAPMVDGKAAKATRTTPELFKKYYQHVIYDDPTIIARFTPAPGKVAGQMSYAARPCKGYTFIAIDSNAYSSDNTDDGQDEHQTRGAITPDLEKWVLGQIKAARNRGDAVIGLMHHNIVPHFTMQSVLETMYLVDDYNRLATEFADAGMHFMFTGHTHSQDVAKFRTAKGNDIIDIETGAGGAYPSPLRILETEHSTKDGKETLSMKGTTVDHLSINYYDAIAKEQRDIPDVSQYGKENLFTKTMFHGYFGIILEDTFSSLGMECPQVVKDEANTLLDKVCDIPVTDDGKYTVLDYANYIYSGNCDGTDNGNYPEWVKEGNSKIQNGALINMIVATAAVWLNSLPSDVAMSLVKQALPEDLLKSMDLNPSVDVYKPIVNAAGKFTGFRGPVLKTIDGLLYDVIISFSNDTNYPDDREFSEVMTTVAPGVMNDGKDYSPADSPKNDTTTYKVLKAVLKELEPST